MLLLCLACFLAIQLVTTAREGCGYVDSLGYVMGVLRCCSVHAERTLLSACMAS